MNRGTTLFLKAAVILIGIPVLALCIFLVPEIANFAAELYPDMSYIKSLVFIDLYASAIPFYIALYQAFKLLGYIDKNNAFSELSVQVLKNIKFCALIISGLYAVGMPLFYLIAEMDDAPGVIVIGLVIIFASMVIAVFAAVLQKLLKEAIEIKSENDLTV
jgi:cellulose synthase/poly-beta-1,6-N-acetylglucosamine synthase-like glycosyltransferase